MQKFKIICVDDEKSILDNLEEQLGRASNLSIELAESAEEALEILEEMDEAGEEIALIISDQLMPGMKGDQLLREVHQKYPNAMKILLTGQAGLESVQNAVNHAKLYRYITKPWDETDLVLTVKEALKSYDDQKTLEIQNRKLSETVQELALKNQELEAAWQEVNASHLQLEQWNKDLEQTIEIRTAAIRNLLDNAGQGFVTFGDDLLVHPEYSSECLWIFGDEIEGKEWVDLLKMPDGDVYRPIFREIFRSEDLVQRSVYITLLPNEIKLNDSIYELEYKPIARHSEIVLMVIITDITAQKKLEEKVKSESKILRMIVSIIQQKSDFLQSTQEFEDFYQHEMADLFQSVQDPKLLKEILFRRVHTYKGVFGQYGLTKTMDHLHHLEAEIGLFTPGLDAISVLINKLRTVQWDRLMAEDRMIIEQVLGKAFFHEKRQLVFEVEKCEQFQQKFMEKMPQSELAWIKSAFAELKQRPIRELLQIYPRYVSDLSERFEKSIRHFNIEGGSTPVDLGHFRHFSKVLLHVFRNIVDHGIETREHRIDIGKDEVGSVFCRIIDALPGENELVIEIGDDGHGIDVDRLRAVATTKGYYSSAELATWSNKELLNLIFVDGLTIKEHVSSISGRGVGMAAVKEETESLGGTLEVESELGVGTVFRWRLPIKQPMMAEVDSNSSCGNVTAQTDPVQMTN